ncbi:MAG: hypothetical protein ABW277_20755 [Longimicrobiaceae bacterium]
MKKLRILLAASVLGLGACGESTLMAPEGPWFDNGSTFGTGHRSSDSTSVNTTAGTTSAERNGSTFGTGY